MARYQTMTLQPPALPQGPPCGPLALRTAWRLASSLDRLAWSRLSCRRESTARLAKSGLGASNRHLPRDKELFVIFAAVMGGEARAVVVMGRAEVSERVGRAETVERASEATRLGGRAGA